MYTNIDIDDSISRISNYLEELWDKWKCKAVVKAMELVMKNNRMRFGDLIYHQIRGVAMSMSPAPTIANLYVSIYEATHILPLLSKYILFYKRFIDNGFAVWLHDLDPTINAKKWTDFKPSAMQWASAGPPSLHARS
jgi:hypothetical protein